MSKEKPEVGDIWSNKDGLTVRVDERRDPNIVLVGWAEQVKIVGGYSTVKKLKQIKMKTFLKDWTYRTNRHR